MLLVDFMRTQIPVDREKEKHFVFNNIKCWSFGERYRIHLYDGNSVDLDGLDVALDIMRDEFTHNPGHWVLQQFDAMSAITNPEYGRQYRKNTSKFGPAQTALPKGNQRLLTVVPAIASDEMPIPPIEVPIEQIRMAVTTYNLMQSWDAMGVTNL